MTLLVLAAAAWWSIRLARADAAFRRHSPADVARAIELAPDNGEYLAALALQAEYSGQDPQPLLEEVAALNPRRAAPRIQLGLAAELRGDPQQAEQRLLEAFSVDRQFETRWTLANFYFRQGRTDEFWAWMKSALEMSYGDRAAAFDLCWQLSNESSSDSREILVRAIPDRREVVASYLVYVLNHHRDVAGAAARLAKMRTADDLPLLYAATDVLLGAGRASEAAELWQALGNPRPDGVTHPNFEPTGPGHGFDWTFAETPGVTHLALDGAHRIRFNGQQPESCELLRQVLGGLHPGVAYTLRWEARTQGIASSTGIEWSVPGSAGAVAATEDWSKGEMTFRPAADHATLQLVYRRPAGQVRTEGYVEIRRVTSSPQ